MNEAKERAVFWWILLGVLAAFWAILAIFVWPNFANAQTESIRAQWAYGMEPDVESFRLFYGETSGSYAIGYTVPLATWVAPPAWMTLPIPLQPGTYYFNVRAIDAGGNQSGPSNEATLTVPNRPPAACSALLTQMP